MTRISKSNKFHESLESLDSSQYYHEATNNIHVTIWPEFINSKPAFDEEEIFVWAYHVRIENKSKQTIQLLKRYWRIIDEDGDIQEVNGEGVTGEQPIISVGGVFQYSSGVHLNNSSGIMGGKYFMKQLDINEMLEVKIPTFSLDTPKNLQNRVN